MSYHRVGLGADDPCANPFSAECTASMMAKTQAAATDAKIRESAAQLSAALKPGAPATSSGEGGVMNTLTAGLKNLFSGQNVKGATDWLGRKIKGKGPRSASAESADAMQSGTGIPLVPIALVGGAVLLGVLLLKRRRDR